MRELWTHWSDVDIGLTVFQSGLLVQHSKQEPDLRVSHIQQTALSMFLVRAVTFVTQYVRYSLLLKYFLFPIQQSAQDSTYYSPYSLWMPPLSLHNTVDIHCFFVHLEPSRVRSYVRTWYIWARHALQTIRRHCQLININTHPLLRLRVTDNLTVRALNINLIIVVFISVRLTSH